MAEAVQVPCSSRHRYQGLKSNLFSFGLGWGTCSTGRRHGRWWWIRFARLDLTAGGFGGRLRWIWRIRRLRHARGYGGQNQGGLVCPQPCRPHADSVAPADPSSAPCTGKTPKFGSQATVLRWSPVTTQHRLRVRCRWTGWLHGERISNDTNGRTEEQLFGYQFGRPFGVLFGQPL